MFLLLAFPLALVTSGCDRFNQSGCRVDLETSLGPAPSPSGEHVASLLGADCGGGKKDRLWLFVTLSPKTDQLPEYNLEKDRVAIIKGLANDIRWDTDNSIIVSGDVDIVSFDKDFPALNVEVRK